MVLPKGNILYEALYATIAFIWVILVVQVISKKFYEAVVKTNPHNVAVYYTRKLIHILAGGLVAISVPYLFSSPLLPFTLAMVLAVSTYLPHKTGKLMTWFQTEDNIYEVHFCIMWGVIVTLAWIIFKDPWYGVIPVSFMAFGDAVTGIVRNAIYKRRTKAWIGNIAMMAFCAPIGFLVTGIPGLVAGIVSSIIEHFELNPLDDNITVPLSAFLVLLVLKPLGL